MEPALVAAVIKDADWLRSTTAARYGRRQVPSGAYDGLAGSGRLADFDPPTQEILYRFYWRGSLGDHASMRRTIGEAIDEVERIREESAPGAKPALGRLARLVAGGDRRRRGRGAAGGGPPTAPQEGGRGAGPTAQPVRKGPARGTRGPPAAGAVGPDGDRVGAPFG